MFEITLYRSGMCWCFDDEVRGIYHEPFVAGASELITKHLERKNILRDGVKIIFSTTPLDDYDVHLRVVEKHNPLEIYTKFTDDQLNTHIGNVGIDVATSKPTSATYIDQEGDICWLCPAQLKFFGEVADEIFARFEE
jgi:hypothetical protein